VLLVALTRRNIHCVSHSLVGGLAGNHVAVQGLLLKRQWQSHRRVAATATSYANHPPQ